MLVRDFLKETDEKFYIRPHVVCADGFRMSIQAGPGVYCRARDGYIGSADMVDYLSGEIPHGGEWEYVEVGLNMSQPQYTPQDKERLGGDSCDEVEDLLVCLFVPIGEVEKECLAHGGIVKIDYTGRCLPVKENGYVWSTDASSE